MAERPCIDAPWSMIDSRRNRLSREIYIGASGDPISDRAESGVEGFLVIIQVSGALSLASIELRVKKSR